MNKCICDIAGCGKEAMRQVPTVSVYVNNRLVPDKVVFLRGYLHFYDAGEQGGRSLDLCEECYNAIVKKLSNTTANATPPSKPLPSS